MDASLQRLSVKVAKAKNLTFTRGYFSILSSQGIAKISPSPFFRLVTIHGGRGSGIRVYRGESLSSRVLSGGAAIEIFGNEVPIPDPRSLTPGSYDFSKALRPRGR